MPDNPASKDGKLRVDQHEGLIHIPGKGPQELIRPIVQRFTPDGLPYQHMPGIEEILSFEEAHQKRLAIVRELLNNSFRCTQCGRVWPGTQARVKWDSLHGAKSEYLFCPDKACAAPLGAVNPTPLTKKIERGEME